MRAEVDELGEVTYDNHKSFTYLTAVFLEVRPLNFDFPLTTLTLLSSRRLFGFILQFLAYVLSSSTFPATCTYVPCPAQNGWETLRDDQLPNGVRLEAGDWYVLLSLPHFLTLSHPTTHQQHLLVRLGHGSR